MRRRLSAWLTSGVILVAPTAFLFDARAADAPAACPTAEAIGPGVHLLAGRDSTPDPANGGQVVNRLFLVGTQGVVVIDPGPTPASGQALRCAIARVTQLPVVAIVLTHPHPENVLASAAFAGAEIYASADAAEAMARRCERCQKHLATLIADPALASLPPPQPDRLITDRVAAAPGGRQLELIPLGPAHSPGDLAVLDRASGLLIAGDVANVDELPDLHDGNVAGWRDALQRLADEPGVAGVIPGRGRPFPPDRLREPLRYLETLWQFARQRVELPEGFVPPPTLPAVLQAFPGDPARHALNLQHALREAEEAWWTQSPAPATR